MKYYKNNMRLSDQAIKIGGFCTVQKDIKKLYGIKSGKKNHLITSFQSIGWTDPFPSATKQEKTFQEPNPD